MHALFCYFGIPPPPSTKPTHAGKLLGELTFARVHAGSVFALARIQENIIEELFSKYSAEILREFISVQMHAGPIFAPTRIQEKIQANLLCIGFVPGRNVPPIAQEGFLAGILLCHSDVSRRYFL